VSQSNASICTPWDLWMTGWTPQPPFCRFASRLSVLQTEYKGNLINQGYPSRLVDDQFSKAFTISRSDLLKPSWKVTKKLFPFVTTFNPNLADVGRIIKKHFTRSYNMTLICDTLMCGVSGNASTIVATAWQWKLWNFLTGICLLVYRKEITGFSLQVSINGAEPGTR